jgi:hypothetical protein
MTLKGVVILRGSAEARYTILVNRGQEKGDLRKFVLFIKTSQSFKRFFSEKKFFKG